MAQHLDMIIQIKNQLSLEFEMTDTGEIGHCLGLNISRNREQRTLTISQSHYVQHILEKFGMFESNPMRTPLNQGTSLTKRNDGNPDAALTARYQQLLGSVMYAMLGTRGDISHAVSVLSRFMSSPDDSHWSAAKRLLRYLRGTTETILVLGGTSSAHEENEIRLVGFCDSDWASDKSDRRSKTGYMFQVNGSTVSWQTKKQHTVALSTVEAEYMALSSAVKECIWLRLLLRELGFPQDDESVIWEDNQGCIALANNPKLHERSKHIDVRHHFIRQNIADSIVKIQYMESERMPADGLTKAVSSTKHQQFIKAFGLQT